MYVCMYMKSLSPGMRSQGKTLGRNFIRNLGFLYRAMRIRSMKPTVKTPEKGWGGGVIWLMDKKSCTTKDDNYSSIYRVLIIPVVQDFFHQQYGWWSCFRLCSDIPPMSVIFWDIFYFVVAHYKAFSVNRNTYLDFNHELALSQRSGVASVGASGVGGGISHRSPAGKRWCEIWLDQNWQQVRCSVWIVPWPWHHWHWVFVMVSGVICWGKIST